MGTIPQAEGAVRPNPVVVIAPLFDQYLGFTYGVEELTVQKPVSRLAIKVLPVAIFLSATGLEKAKEAAFGHRERDSIGIAVSARDRQANKDGKKVTVEQRTPPKPKKSNASNTVRNPLSPLPQRQLRVSI